MVELNRGNESLPVRCLFFFFFIVQYTEYGGSVHWLLEIGAWKLKMKIKMTKFLKFLQVRIHFWKL